MTSVRSPREIARLLRGGREGRRDELIPDDHPQVVVLRDLLGDGHCGHDHPDRQRYEDRCFVAYLTLYAEFKPNRVGDVTVKLINEAFTRLVDEASAADGLSK